MCCPIPRLVTFERFSAMTVGGSERGRRRGMRYRRRRMYSWKRYKRRRYRKEEV